MITRDQITEILARHLAVAHTRVTMAGSLVASYSCDLTPAVDELMELMSAAAFFEPIAAYDHLVGAARELVDAIDKTAFFDCAEHAQLQTSTPEEDNATVDGSDHCPLTLGHIRRVRDLLPPR